MSEFRTAIEARDLDRAVGLFADDVTLRSPAVFGEYAGRDAVEPVIRAVAMVFEDFEYVQELHSADGSTEALLFRARVGDRELEGCDFVTWDADGRITELAVMIRPLSGLTALVEAMRALLG